MHHPNHRRFRPPQVVPTLAREARSSLPAPTLLHESCFHARLLHKPLRTADSEKWWDAFAQGPHVHGPHWDEGGDSRVNRVCSPTVARAMTFGGFVQQPHATAKAEAAARRYARGVEATGIGVAIAVIS